LLTPKEINGLIRGIKDEMFNYSEFKERVFNVRLDLACSRILETNISKLSQHIINECLKLDEIKEGKLNILLLRNILFKSKMINLTPFQIFLVLGFSNPDKTGEIDYKQFAS